MPTVKEQILNFIQERGVASPNELKNYTAASGVSVHKNLGILLQEGKIKKQGLPPRVLYFPQVARSTEAISVSAGDRAFIDKYYLNFSAKGETWEGWDGFYSWCVSLNLPVIKTSKEYIKTVKQYEQYRNGNGFIDGMPKLTTTFNNVYLDEIYYLDFYSIERFGKTRLGSILTAAKLPNKLMINKVIEEMKPRLKQLIDEKSIGTIGFIPPSVKREVQLMKKMEEELRFNLPLLPIIKFKPEINIPQKALRKLGDRVINAENTMYIDSNFVEAGDKGNILLVDDAMGSGATLNVVAKKIRERIPNLGGSIIGLAVTGSFKGFDVLPVV